MSAERQRAAAAAGDRIALRAVTDPGRIGVLIRGVEHRREGAGGGVALKSRPSVITLIGSAGSRPLPTG